MYCCYHYLNQAFTSFNSKCLNYRYYRYYDFKELLMVVILKNQARTSFFLSSGLISLVAQRLFKTHQTIEQYDHNIYTYIRILINFLLNLFQLLINIFDHLLNLSSVEFLSLLFNFLILNILFILSFFRINLI